MKETRLVTWVDTILDCLSNKPMHDDDRWEWKNMGPIPPVNPYLHESIDRNNISMKVQCWRMFPGQSVDWVDIAGAQVLALMMGLVCRRQQVDWMTDCGHKKPERGDDEDDWIDFLHQRNSIIKSLRFLELLSVYFITGIDQPWIEGPGGWWRRYFN